MDRSPAAMLAIIVGMNSGLTRLAPRSWSTTDSCSKISMPPMPVPKMQAKRVASSLSMSMPAWANASSEAIIAYWTKGAKRRDSFLVKPASSGS